MENPNKKLTDDVILKNVLVELRYSAKKVAELLGMTPSALYHILHKKNRISSDLANTIVTKFPEISYVYLTSGNGPVTLDKSGKQTQTNVFTKEIKEDLKDVKFDDIPKTLKNIESLLQKIYDKM